MAGSECTVCSFMASPPEGGWYAETDLWRVGPHPSAKTPGWICAFLKRHAEGLTEMNAEELASMGPVLGEAAAALTEVTSPERVYMMLFGENAPHVHIVLMPRGKDVPPEHRSSSLHVNGKLYADPEAYEATGAKIRATMQAK